MKRNHFLLALPSLLMLVVYGGLLHHQTKETAPVLSVVLGERLSDGQKVVVHSNREINMFVDGEPRRLSEVVPHDDGPGLHTVTWSTSYMGRAPWTVAHSYLVGPFGRTGWIRKGARLSLAQALLDDGDDGKKGDLATALIPLVKGTLDHNLVVRKFVGEVDKVELRIRMGDFDVGVETKVQFLDHADRCSLLTADVRLTPDVIKNRLVVRAGAVAANLTGQARQNARSMGRGAGFIVGAVGVGILTGGLGFLFGGLGGAVVGDSLADDAVDRIVKKAANAMVRDLIPRMNRVLRRFLNNKTRLSILHPKLRVQWKPSGILLRRSVAMHLFFDVVVVPQFPSRVVRSSPGPVKHGKNLSGASDMMSNVRIDLSANLFNQLSHVLWRHGLLDETLNRETNLDRITDQRVKELLAFDVEEVEATLPPLISSWSEGRIALRFGGLRLDLEHLEGGRRLPPSVTLHGVLFLCPALDRRKQNLLISVEPAPLITTCGEGTPDDPLTPCFSSFIGIANKALSQHGAFSFPISLGGKRKQMELGSGMGELSITIEPVTVGINEGKAPSVRGDVNLRVAHSWPRGRRLTP